MEDISNEIKAKAEFLLRDGKVRKGLDTEKRVYFEVDGDSGNHSVIFDKEKNRWECDCKFFSLNQKECSHIISAQFLLKSKV